MAMANMFNEGLHRRVNEAVREGTVKVADAERLPDSERFVTLVVDNLNAGRPLLEGLTVFRGAKDPDVDAGTFDSSHKHATPQLHIARGYAETANQHIGLASKDTKGFGMLAEYSLPKDAVFYRNFGLEAAHTRGNSVAGLTLEEVELRIKPLAEAYAGAQGETKVAAAKAALLEFRDRELYELALPAHQQPVRQWVVQHDDVQSRLLVHEDRGPLADVMIDVLKARKAAVDEHTPARVRTALETSAERPVDALSAGLGEALHKSSALIAANLADRRDATFGIAHESLSDAIAWRKEAQSTMRIEQLTNSGIAIEHGDPELRVLPVLQRAAEEIEMASYRLTRRPEMMEALSVAEAGRHASVARGQHKSTLDSLEAQEKKVSSDIDLCRSARSKAFEKWDLAEKNHRANDSKNLVSRLLYRFNGRAQALAEIATVESHVKSIERTLDALGQEWSAANGAVKEAQRTLTGLDSDLDALGVELRRLDGEGKLAFLRPDVHDLVVRPDVHAWEKLVAEIRTEIGAADAIITRGREAGELIHAVAEKGLDAGVKAHLARRELSVQQERGVATEHPERAAAGVPQSAREAALRTVLEAEMDRLGTPEAIRVAHRANLDAALATARATGRDSDIPEPLTADHSPLPSLAQAHHIDASLEGVSVELDR
jgi:hypothetical protein